MVRFQSDRIASDGEHIVFPLKDDAVIEETRQSERFSFTADERVVSEILNPFDGETRLSKSVMDMSATRAVAADHLRVEALPGRTRRCRRSAS